MTERKVKAFLFFLDDDGRAYLQPICATHSPEKDFFGIFAPNCLEMLMDKDKIIPYKSIRAAYKKGLIPEAKKIKKGWKEVMAIGAKRLRSRLAAWIKGAPIAIMENRTEKTNTGVKLGEGGI